MQRNFLFAFVLMGACLIQATSADPLVLEGAREASNINENAINTANQVIERLTTLTRQQIYDALYTLYELNYQIGEQVYYSTYYTKENLQELFEKAQQTIQQIQERAKQAGINITICLKNSDDKLQELLLLQKSLAEEIPCGTGKVATVIKMIIETIKVFTDITKAVKKLPNDIRDCLKTILIPFSCINKIVSNALNMEKNLPLKIAKKVQEVIDFVAGSAGLQICTTSQLTNAGISVARIVGDVAKCAAEKGLKDL